MASVVTLGGQVWFEGGVGNRFHFCSRRCRGDKFRSVARVAVRGREIVGDDTQAARWGFSLHHVVLVIGPAQRAKLDQRAEIVHPLLEYDGDIW